MPHDYGLPDTQTLYFLQYRYEKLPENYDLDTVGSGTMYPFDWYYL